jgi:hypothetical protein
MNFNIFVLIIFKIPEKFLIAVISSSILVFLFIAGRILDSIIARKKQKIDWYLSVIITPNVPKAYEFYKKVLTSAKSSYLKLKKNEDSENISEVKTLEMAKIQKLKRDFEFSFLALISANYSQTAFNLTDMLLVLENDVTEFLDQFADSSLESFEIKVLESKVDFFKELYSPLELNRFVQWFKKNYLWAMVLILLIMALLTFLPVYNK